jgi:phenylacetic acid degradation operon negative regulatory protein
VRTVARPRTHSPNPERLLDAIEPLQPQRLVLTMVGHHGRNFRLIWSGGLVELLGYFGFSQGAARIALSRLCQRGRLTRVKSGRLVYYRLTNESEQVMAEGDRRIFSFGKERNDADTWTVVWHSVPDDQRLKRAVLARRLRFLGFGPVQDGTWVAPHDREEDVVQLLTNLEVTEFAGVLLGRPAASLDFRSLIGRAWDLADIDERYRRFIASFEPFADPAVQKRMGGRDAFMVLALMTDVFKGFPSTDPELPSDVMHGDLRTRAVEIFHAIFEALIEPAQAHFDEVATTAAPSPARASRGKSA